MERICSTWSKFFPLRVDSLEDIHYLGKQILTTLLSPCRKKVKGNEELCIHKP